MANASIPDLKKQIDQARRANYTPQQILEYLKDKDDRINTALQEGYRPEEILDFLAPPSTMMENVGRQAQIAAGGAAPGAIATSLGAAVAGPVGGMVGSFAYPATDALVGAINSFLSQNNQLPIPSEEMRKILRRAGIGAEPETTGERMLQAGAEAMTGTVGAVAPKMAGVRLPGAAGTAVEEFGRAPISQMAAAGTAAPVSQGVGEVTESPVAALLSGAAVGAATGIRPRARATDVTADSMNARIRDAFKRAEDANLSIEMTPFTQRGFSLDSKLRDLGWRPDNPQLEGITRTVQNLQKEVGPKDLQDLQRIRNEIKMSANPNDPNAYRLMKVVLNDFDDYLDDLPSSSIISKGDQEGARAWAQARKLFNAEKKAEVFEKMLFDLPAERTKFGQSGAENFLANELRKIAKNEKKMRLFTQAEQAEIRKAAQGGSLQNMLRYVGRFAPIGAIPQISSAALMYADPMLGTIPAAGYGARMASEQMRIGDVQRLTDLMRTGVMPPTMTQNIPATLSRGLLSTQIDEER